MLVAQALPLALHQHGPREPAVLPEPLRLLLQGQARRREVAQDRKGGPPSAHGRSEVPQVRGVPLSPIWVTVRLVNFDRLRSAGKSDLHLMRSAVLKLEHADRLHSLFLFLLDMLTECDFLSKLS